MPLDSFGTTSNADNSASYDAGEAGFDVVSAGDYSASISDPASFDDARDSGFDVIPEIESLFISHSDWMQRTHLTIGSRSAELRRLDEAIRIAEFISFDMQFMEEDIDLLFQRGFPISRIGNVKAALAKEAYLIVRPAFQRWAKSEGDWKGSRRNKQLAATQVHRELAAYQKKYGDPVKDAELREAESYMSIALGKQAAEIFGGSKVQLRGLSSVLSEGKNVHGKAKDFFGLSKQLIELMVGSSTNEMEVKDPAFARLLGTIAPSLASKICEFSDHVPVVGILTNTVSAIAKTYDAYDTSQNRIKLLRVQEAIPVADAHAALSVIKSWQDRYIREQAAAAAADAAHAGTHVLTALVPAAAPASLALGVAKSLAKLLNLIADLAQQYKQARALEEYLKNPESIGLEIFSISPLVGAYYILNASLTTFSQHLCPYDSPTFMEDAQYLRESGEMKAVLSDAARIIAASKYVLTKDGLQFRTRESDGRLTQLGREYRARLSLKISAARKSPHSSTDNKQWADMPESTLDLHIDSAVQKARQADAWALAKATSGLHSARENVGKAMDAGAILAGHLRDRFSKSR